MGLRFCEFRRIENDQIERPAGIAGGSEKLEDICLDDFEAIGFGDAVSGEIGLEGGQCGIGSVDLRDMLCAILEACETKTAIVAECIEHISIAGEFSDERMVKRLIEIGAGFLSIRDIDDGSNAIAEADFDGVVIRVCAGAPCEFAAFRGETFAGSGRGIGAFVDSDDVREEIEEDFGENLAEGFEPGRENLNAQDVVIAVDDETGETIGFSVDDSERISVGGALEEAPAVGGVVDLISEPVRSRKRRIVTEGEHPDADLGSRGEKSDSKRCILRGGEDAHECTGFERFSVCIGWYICDCAGEDPRVVPQEGTFAAGFEANSGQGIAHGLFLGGGAGIRKRPHRAALPRARTDADGASGRSRTDNLLITNQLHCHCATLACGKQGECYQKRCYWASGCFSGCFLIESCEQPYKRPEKRWIQAFSRSLECIQ